MAMMRVMGEVIDGTASGLFVVQEAIFDSTQLAFATQEVKRIRDREQVFITRDDIKYVVADVCSKRCPATAWIREYLQQFTLALIA
jgi:hypothetical protein